MKPRAEARALPSTYTDDSPIEYLNIPGDWADAALCAGIDPDLWFPGPGSEETGIRLCWECPVREECLDYAMEAEGDANRHMRHGVWGGMTSAERARLAQERRTA